MSQLEDLAKPFRPALVKEPAQGKFGRYVPHDVVTQKLLYDVGPFDFTVREIIRGKDGTVEAVLAAMTITVDGRRVSVTEVGDCEHPEQKHTEGERLKDCLSDAVKRCAMRFGVGLHLWSHPDYFLHDALVARAQRTADGPPPVVLPAIDPLPVCETEATT